MGSIGVVHSIRNVAESPPRADSDTFLAPRFGARLGGRRAGAAGPKDLVPMAVADEADAGCDLVLDPLGLRAGELEGLAARLADQVVVVLPLVLPLERR